MSVAIDTWSNRPSEQKELLTQIRNIFFLCSNRKEFLTDAEKERFFEKWTQYYLDFYPKSIYLAIEENSSTLLGYLMGCENSQQATPLLINGIPSYDAFSDQFQKYNCHLHINLHPDARGKSVGSTLFSTYKNRLIKEGQSGLHIITSPKSKNVSFYQKNGLTTKITRNWKGYPLLFMGASFNKN